MSASIIEQPNGQADSIASAFRAEQQATTDTYTANLYSIYFQKGMSYAKLRDVKEAESYFKQAIALKLTDVNTRIEDVYNITEKAWSFIKDASSNSKDSKDRHNNSLSDTFDYQQQTINPTSKNNSINNNSNGNLSNKSNGASSEMGLAFAYPDFINSTSPQYDKQYSDYLVNLTRSNDLYKQMVANNARLVDSQNQNSSSNIDSSVDLLNRFMVNMRLGSTTSTPTSSTVPLGSFNSVYCNNNNDFRDNNNELINPINGLNGFSSNSSNITSNNIEALKIPRTSAVDSSYSNGFLMAHYSQQKDNSNYAYSDFDSIKLLGESQQLKDRSILEDNLAKSLVDDDNGCTKLRETSAEYLKQKEICNYIFSDYDSMNLIDDGQQSRNISVSDESSTSKADDEKNNGNLASTSAQYSLQQQQKSNFVFSDYDSINILSNLQQSRDESISDESSLSKPDDENNAKSTPATDNATDAPKVGRNGTNSNGNSRPPSANCNKTQQLKSMRATNVMAYKSLWIGSISPKCKRNILERVFEKFGKITSIHLLSGRLSTIGTISAFVNYDNPESPIKAICDLRNKYIPYACVDRKSPLQFRLTPDDQHKRYLNKNEAKLRTAQLGECFYWRNYTRGCLRQNQCEYRHNPMNRAIDNPPWLLELS